jgi:predicted protein tyrosine phosphatase
MEIDFLNDFNYLEYKYLNKDLGDINEYESKQHYLKYGKKEKRLYKFDVPSDFNYLEYKYLNKDLGNINEFICKEHYIDYGKKEKRLYKFDIPSDFNYLEYKYLNKDLGNINEFECKEHYEKKGRLENRLYKFDIPSDFNYLEYKYLNRDLGNINEFECKEHYEKKGRLENRLYKFDIPSDFNYLEYKYLNKDLGNISEFECKEHYEKKGKIEKRLYKFDIPEDFNYDNYKLLNKDLKDISEIECKYHYTKYGKYENRLYKFKVPCDFNYITYKYINKDLDSVIEKEDDFKKHYIEFGINELRNYSEFYLIKLYVLYYNKNILNFDFSSINELKFNNFKKILDSMNRVSINGLDKNILLENYYKINIKEGNNSFINKNINYIDNYTENGEYSKFNNIFDIISNNKKEYFRYICYRYLNYIRNKKINIDYNSSNHNETVFIEFEILHHIEFNIRNMCNQLPNWKHTIICGTDNYSYIKNICKNISEKINIINLDINNINIDEYSKLLTSKYFWDLFTGNHILIHKEDSLIFNGKDIDKWLKYDYVGAPWLKGTYKHNYLVGNGGFSLRKKSKMIYICNNYDINNYKIFDFTKKYMSDNNLKIIPEDCFFVKCIVDNNLGLIPPYEEAIYFSSASIKCKESLGGYNFWIGDDEWLDRFDKIIKQYYSYGITYLKKYNHRFGWNNLLMILYVNDIITIFNKNNNIELIDLCENHFIWEDNKVNNNWIGIAHLTIDSPIFLENLNINYLLKNNNFNDSIKKCKILITLSKYLEEYIKKNIKYDFIDTINIYHPIKESNIVFNYEEYLANNNKYIIQIGSQMRIFKTFLYLNFKNHKKIWLTSNIDNTISILKKELKLDDYYKLNLIDFNIEHKYVSSDEYDDLLKKNIIFVHLYDSSANNTILEAISYKVPIIVNRHPAVVEYLGDNYPLYFNDEDEINDDFISNDRILQAYNYLNQYNFNDFSYKKFNQELLELL